MKETHNNCFGPNKLHTSFCQAKTAKHECRKATGITRTVSICAYLFSPDEGFVLKQMKASLNIEMLIFLTYSFECCCYSHMPVRRSWPFLGFRAKRYVTLQKRGLFNNTRSPNSGSYDRRQHHILHLHNLIISPTGEENFLQRQRV